MGEDLSLNDEIAHDPGKVKGIWTEWSDHASQKKKKVSDRMIEQTETQTI